ncbi:MAG TPA: FtsX-like permease family protein [Rhizobiaceae bacterium]|nr:FtsX-like permease family protein [Rhizobiaceae bacterium]
MTLLTLAYRNLLRRPARTTLLVFSIAIAFATALSLLALSRGIETTTHEGAEERGADLTVSQVDASDVFSGVVPESHAAKIAAMPGVRGVSGEILMFTPIDDERQILTVGMAENSYFWGAMPIADGRKPEKDERWVVLLGQGAAQALGKGVGDTLTMFDQEMKIVGVTGYRAPINRGAIVARLQDVQELAFKHDVVTLIHVAIDPSLTLAQAEALGAEIERLGRVSASPTEQLFSRDRNVAVLRAISQVTSFIALTMAGLSVLNVLLMAVQERVRETGIMMAIGWSDRRIIATIILEGVITGALGSLLGIPLGFLACGFFEYLPTIGAYLDITPPLDAILISVAGALALSALGSLYPAWRAVSHTPADALRRA